jgi:hypothetical protein
MKNLESWRQGMVTREILETSDYDSFVSVANRHVSKSHVQKLLVSMRIRGFDNTHPLRVAATSNGKLKLLDGQHRLEAAKELGLPVSYVKIEGDPDEDVYFSNAFNKSWSSGDFLKYWCDRGKEDYIKLKNFMERHDLNVYSAYMLCGTGVKDKISGHKFRLGEFKISDKEIEVGETAAKQVNDIRFFDDKTTSVSKTQTFTRAIAALIKSEFYDHDRMLSGLSRKSYVLQSSGRLPEYFKMFEEIYNHKTKNRYVLKPNGNWQVIQSAATK